MNSRRFGDQDPVAAPARRPGPVGSSRRLASNKFRSPGASSNKAAKPAGERPLHDESDGSSPSRIVSRQNPELRHEGRRLGSLGGGRLRITCGCGHSGDVPVAALVARHGEEARVRDAVASMRCSNCGARRVQELRWLD